MADPTGITLNIDWDAVAEQRATVPAVLPTILGLSTDRMTEISHLSEYSRVQVAGVELLRLQQSIDDDAVMNL